jgi:hypothetical protein
MLNLERFRTKKSKTLAKLLEREIIFVRLKGADVKRKNKMKKILLVSAIAVFGLGAFLGSCSSDDDKACSCTESDGYGYNATRNVTPSSYGASNCADLELKLKKETNGEYYYSCH